MGWSASSHKRLREVGDPNGEPVKNDLHLHRCHSSFGRNTAVRHTRYRERPEGKQGGKNVITSSTGHKYILSTIAAASRWKQRCWHAHHTLRKQIACRTFLSVRCPRSSLRSLRLRDKDGQLVGWIVVTPAVYEHTRMTVALAGRIDMGTIGYQMLHVREKTLKLEGRHGDLFRPAVVVQNQ